MTTKTSQITILNPKASYKAGETIDVKIDFYNPTNSPVKAVLLMALSMEKNNAPFATYFRESISEFMTKSTMTAERTIILPEYPVSYEGKYFSLSWIISAIIIAEKDYHYTTNLPIVITPP